MRRNENVIFTKMDELYNEFIAKKEITMKSTDGEIYLAIEPTINCMAELYASTCATPGLVEDFKSVGNLALFEILPKMRRTKRFKDNPNAARSVLYSTVREAMSDFWENERQQSLRLHSDRNHYDDTNYIVTKMTAYEALQKVLPRSSYEIVSRRCIYGETIAEVCESMRITREQYKQYKACIAGRIYQRDPSGTVYEMLCEML